VAIRSSIPATNSNQQWMTHLYGSTKDFAWDFQGLSRRRLFFDFDLDASPGLLPSNHPCKYNHGKYFGQTKADSLAGDRLYRMSWSGTGSDSKTTIFTEVPKRRDTNSRLGMVGHRRADLNVDGYPEYMYPWFPRKRLFIHQPKNGTSGKTGKSMAIAADFHGQRCWRINNDGFRHHHIWWAMKTWSRPPPGMIPYEIYKYKLSNGFIIRQPATAFNEHGWFLIRLFFFKRIAIQAGIEGNDWAVTLFARLW